MKCYSRVGVTTERTRIVTVHFLPWRRRIMRCPGVCVCCGSGSLSLSLSLGLRVVLVCIVSRLMTQHCLLSIIRLSVTSSILFYSQHFLHLCLCNFVYLVLFFLPFFLLLLFSFSSFSSSYPLLFFLLLFLLLLLSMLYIGQSGLGKSTLINSLFMTDIYEDSTYNGSGIRMPKTTQVSPNSSVVRLGHLNKYCDK